MRATIDNGTPDTCPEYLRALMLANDLAAAYRDERLPCECRRALYEGWSALLAVLVEDDEAELPGAIRAAEECLERYDEGEDR